MHQLELHELGTDLVVMVSCIVLSNLMVLVANCCVVLALAWRMMALEALMHELQLLNLSLRRDKNGCWPTPVTVERGVAS